MGEMAVGASPSDWGFVVCDGWGGWVGGRDEIRQETNWDWFLINMSPPSHPFSPIYTYVLLEAHAAEVELRPQKLKEGRGHGIVAYHAQEHPAIHLTNI